MRNFVILKRSILFCLALLLNAEACIAVPAPDFAFLKVAVFPIKTEKNYGPVLEEAWTAVRAEFVRDEQFMVATKAFMLEHQAFLPRGVLAPLEVATVSKLLNAEAVVTLTLDDRDFTMNVYDGATGELFWRYTHRISAVYPVQNQIVKVAGQIARDMVAMIPYHGFLRPSKNFQQFIVKDKENTFTQFKPRRSGAARIGDPVQVVRLERVSLEPLFQKGGQVRVLAEGFVTGVDNDELVVQITRYVPQTSFQLTDLVRLPKEAERLLEQTEIVNKQTSLGIEFMAQELELVERPSSENEQTRNIVTTGAFISTMVTFLLLAL